MADISELIAVAATDVAAWKLTRGIDSKWARRIGLVLLACAACWLIVG